MIRPAGIDQQAAVAADVGLFDQGAHGFHDSGKHRPALSRKRSGPQQRADIRAHLPRFQHFKMRPFLHGFKRPKGERARSAFAHHDRIAGDDHAKRARSGLRAAIRATQAEIVWQTRRATARIASPVVHNGYYFTVSSLGVLTCYDPETGEVLVEEADDKVGKLIQAFLTHHKIEKITRGVQKAARRTAIPLF